MKNIVDFTDEELFSAFRAAHAAGLAAAAKVSDGGSCNRDRVFLLWSCEWGRVKPKQAARIATAASRAGVYCSWYKSAFWKGFFLGAGPGQGQKNTVYSEAMADSLKRAELPASVYYQVD